MHATIKKMSKQVDKLQQDVEDAKDKLDAAKRKVIVFFVQKQGTWTCIMGLKNNLKSYVQPAPNTCLVHIILVSENFYIHTILKLILFVAASRWFDGR